MEESIKWNYESCDPEVFFCCFLCSTDVGFSVTPISTSSRGEEQTGLLPSSFSRKTIPFSKLDFFYIRLLRGSIREQQQLICLRSDRLYTFGRKRRHCQIVFDHCCISRRHCQIFFDGADRRLRLVDGFLLSRDSDLGEIRRRLRSERQVLGFSVSLNGVFVNRRKLRGGVVAVLSEGDEVVFGCGRLRSVSRCARKYGFVVESIVLSDFAGTLDVTGQVMTRAGFLQNLCQRVLRSDDPMSYLRCSVESNVGTISSIHGVKNYGSAASYPVLVSEGHSRQNDKTANYAQNEKNLTADDVGNAETSPSSLERGISLCNSLSNGQSLFLNRLEFMAHDTSYQHTEVTLMELLDPVESLVQVFIATFTCDVSWFLSYCKIPNHLPVTIAFHSAEKCWSSSCDDRTSAPYSDYPNLLLVYPPFPDEIAFGKDRSKKGVACHHPKLLVLQREESVRVVVTSANLVSKQWNQITNTVWWQDFPRRDAPDYSSLFATIKDLKSDFAAQLAGFIASLITDVPSQAHWIKDLARFDFGSAAAYLIASIPGMHALYTISSGSNLLQNAEHIVLSKFTTSTKYLGFVQASVVGLRYRFHNAADSRGEQLKKLALFLGKFKDSSSRLMEVVLKRNHCIPADANAISIFVSNLDEMSNGDSVQLGFLPRDVAKWAAPLVDHGFLEFSAFVCPKEALAAALDGNNTKVQCLLSIAQGPKFSEMSRLIQPEHLPALCLFIASIQRCLGLWRLKEVISQYKWPEYLETDFVYASSSVGTSMNAQFLAAFSAAAGKKSFQFSESDESDPEWGCWSTDHEVKSPSIRILFPTIERVKSSAHSIPLSKYLLSFSENTWQRLRTTGILYDAVPNPAYRIGYPMHVKVARRRFQSKTSTSSFGWIYCGSHNFSPAAWGRVISPSTVNGGSGAHANVASGARLRICNYELGIILIIPPPSTMNGHADNLCSLDDIKLPFVMPAPRYCGSDRPATACAMRGAMAECLNAGQLSLTEQDFQGMEEEDVAEEEIIGPSEYIAEENEDDKIYAEMLWSQVDSSDNF